MKKNYIILCVLFLTTMLVTLFLSSLYVVEDKDVSYAYKELPKISYNELSQNVIENPYLVLYLSNKNDLEYENFEKKFLNKLNKLNLFEYTVYMDELEITKEFLEILEKDFSYEYKKGDLPYIIVFVDGKIVDSAEVYATSNVEELVDYGVFE